MCSLSASPLPTPKVKRPSRSTAEVAVAWARIAGWIRIDGHVTAVVIGSRVTCDKAPIIDQTNALWPCSSFHGWKWSLIQRAWNPARSAIRACSSNCAGLDSSLDRK